MTAFACIATRNEAETIGPLAQALMAQGVHVVIEDESDDEHIFSAACSGAEIHHIPGSRRTGLGPSLMRGWKRALELGADVIVQMDAGGSHRVEDAVGMLETLPADCELAIGSRFCKGARYIGSPHRALLSRLATAACNGKIRREYRVSDWTSGLRIFTADTVRYLLRFDYHAKMHGWQIEVLMRALGGNRTVYETPIAYTAGRSAFNGRVAVEAFKVWRRL